jgi:hypothetical protein
MQNEGPEPPSIPYVLRFDRWEPKARESSAAFDIEAVSTGKARQTIHPPHSRFEDRDNLALDLIPRQDFEPVISRLGDTLPKGVPIHFPV